MTNETRTPSPDCALCGKPFHRHSGGSPNTCPIIATYRPRTPAPIEPQPDDYSGAMVFEPGDGQDATNVSSGTPTLNETGHSYNEPDHDGIMQPVDPADFDRELIDAQRAGEKIGRARGRRFARKVSQRHAKHGARL